MVYILSVHLKSLSRVLYSIVKLRGIGAYTCNLVLNDLNIGYDCRIKDLRQNKVINIIKWIEKYKIVVENNLKRKIVSDINKLKDIKTFKGLRHIYRLSFINQTRKINSNANKIKSF